MKEFQPRQNASFDKTDEELELLAEQEVSYLKDCFYTFAIASELAKRSFQDDKVPLTATIVSDEGEKIGFDARSVVTQALDLMAKRAFDQLTKLGKSDVVRSTFLEIGMKKGQIQNKNAA